jgi:hypothetical protein
MSIKATPFPHLLPVDAAVWQRWLDRYGHLFKRFDYDLKVGRGRDPGPATDPKMRQMAVTLSQRRIDAVGYRGSETHLFEITTLADLKCLGQIQAYPLLYAQTFPTLGILKTAVVAERLGTDLETAYRQANVTVYLV